MKLTNTRYVISLSERSDRRKDFIISAAKAGIKDYTFFKAIKGEGKIDAQRGCRLSHKAVIELARDLKLPEVTILEDDAIFTKDFKQKLVSTSIPEDWEMIYYGAHHHKPPVPISPGISRCKYALSTVCYAIKESLYDRIIALLEQDLILDMIYATQLQPHVKAYCFTPNLVTQAPGLSNIENKVKDYSAFYGISEMAR